MRILLESVYKERGQAGVRSLYAIMQERSIEVDAHVNISHRALPPYKQHAAFVRSKPYRRWYFVKVDGLVAGSLTISKLNEIGIVLLADYRGKGIGKQALQMLLARHSPLPPVPGQRVGHFLANINPLNKRSIRLFTGLGFNLKQHTYEL